MFHGAGFTQLLWCARADNLGDVLAYPVSSPLTQTAPGKAPLPVVACMVQRLLGMA